MSIRQVFENFLGHWHVTLDLLEGGSCLVARECVLCGFVIHHGGDLDRSFDELNAENHRVSAEVKRHDVLCHPGNELWAQRMADFRGALQAAIPSVGTSQTAAICYGLKLLEWPDTFGRWCQ